MSWALHFGGSLLFFYYHPPIRFPFGNFQLVLYTHDSVSILFCLLILFLQSWSSQDLYISYT